MVISLEISSQKSPSMHRIYDNRISSVCVYFKYENAQSLQQRCEKPGKTGLRYTKLCKYILSAEPQRSGDIHDGMFDDYRL